MAHHAEGKNHKGQHEPIRPENANAILFKRGACVSRLSKPRKTSRDAAIVELKKNPGKPKTALG